MKIKRVNVLSRLRLLLFQNKVFVRGFIYTRFLFVCFCFVFCLFVFVAVVVVVFV